MTKLKNRQGAILVLAAFLMVVALSMFVVVVDLSRVFLQKNELQTSVDAAALAGVLELYRDTALVDDSAISFGVSNKVLKLSPIITNAGVKCGVWNDTNRTFTVSASCTLSDNAVEVAGSAPAQASMPAFMSLVGLQVAAKATAWQAYVDGTKCIKPFGLPYTSLTYVLRPDQGNPVDPYPLRPLDDGDLYRLRTFTRDQLRFSLKVAANGEPRNGPGNFGAMDLDREGGGASSYKDDIINCDNTQLGISSLIDTETGNMVQSTVKGVETLCEDVGSMVGEECQDANGDMGVPVLVPLWYSATPVNGRKTVRIIQIGAFKLDSITPRAAVIGHFIGFATGGTIGKTRTTITRPILVK